MNKLKVFNVEALAELRQVEEVGEPGLVREICTLFLDSSSEFVSKLKEYSQNADARNFEMTAHSLKSSAKALGLERVAQTCFEMERSAREKVIPSAKIPELETHLAEARKELERFLADGA